MGQHTQSTWPVAAAQSALHMPQPDPDVVLHLCHAEEEDDLAPRDLDDILGFKVRCVGSCMSHP